jgi:hypothetical protein
VPVLVNGVTEARGVVAGGLHSMAFTVTGTVYAWGDNALGQLGDGTTNSRPEPALVGGLGGVAEIAANFNDSYALIPNATSVQGTVAFEGLLNPMGETVTFTFRPRDGSVPFSRTVVLGVNGSFNLIGIPFLNYDLAVKGRKWLRTVVHADASTGPVFGLSIVLRPGDINNDNVIDLFDLITFFEAYGSSSNPPNGPADANWNELADFNGDDIIDLFDLIIFFEFFGAIGDP